ncbi:MAG: hypothetical protein OEW15_09265 [Nitrospirota bacterium]|nr:hypothetical protein [Nitrospirota bacterium]
MSRINFIEHKGKKLLHLDLANAKAPDVIKLVKDATPVIAAQPEKSIRTLTDVTDLTFNVEATEALKHFTKHNKPYVIAGAVVGVTGLKQIIYNAVLKFSGRNIVAFDSLDEAKNWLSTQ